MIDHEPIEIHPTITWMDEDIEPEIPEGYTKIRLISMDGPRIQLNETKTLSDILLNPGSNSIDIIWGPELDNCHLKLQDKDNEIGQK